MLSTFFAGLRLGFLLQLAVGPVCLMVFNFSGNLGFLAGFIAVLAVTVVDMLFIVLAGAGISVFLRGRRAQLLVSLLGGLVLALFGLDILLSALNLSFMPKINLFSPGAVSGEGLGGVFLRAALLTASNPLAIVFFGGLFSTKAIEYNLDARGLALFGGGCVCATFLALTVVAGLGSAANTFLPPLVIRVLNGAVGVFLFFFALRMLRRGFGRRNES